MTSFVTSSSSSDDTVNGALLEKIERLSDRLDEVESVLSGVDLGSKLVIGDAVASSVSARAGAYASVCFDDLDDEDGYAVASVSQYIVQGDSSEGYMGNVGRWTYPRVATSYSSAIVGGKAVTSAVLVPRVESFGVDSDSGGLVCKVYVSNDSDVSRDVKCRVVLVKCD